MRVQALFYLVYHHTLSSHNSTWHKVIGEYLLDE